MSTRKTVQCGTQDKDDGIRTETTGSDYTSPTSQKTHRSHETGERDAKLQYLNRRDQQRFRLGLFTEWRRAIRFA